MCAGADDESIAECLAVFPAEPVCDCTGPYTQTCHVNNPEGHQVGCPRWGIPNLVPFPW